ncbi:MAG TPA: hypothetical protein VMK12_12230, partial [Anaeromyxobacteraceae bacterium]|nr:hypothetical protein [Anaeromyxobacteraceae bacterium]
MRPLPVVSRATGAALAVAMLSGCAAGLGSIDRAEKGPRGASARELGRAGFAAYLSRNDGGTAEHRFAEAVRRDPQDPWARLGASLMARRRLDDAAEVAQLLALVEGAPAHPLVPLAARRLGVLAELAPPRAREVEAGLAQVQPRLAGLAAARARAARAAAAAALGDGARAHLLRAQGGAITAFSLVGPFGGLHALEIDTRFEPEAGALPASAPAWGGLPPVPARPVSCPDGAIDLDAEPLEGDIFYLAADATPSRGGDYLLIMAGTSTLRAFVDGAPVAERRAYAGFPPVAQVVPISLAPGRHRLLVKIGRG